jgi:hypothetical protein
MKEKMNKICDYSPSILIENVFLPLFLPPCPPEGGYVSVFMKILFMCEYKPHFRGVGGSKKEYNNFLEQVRSNRSFLLIIFNILRNPVPNL